MSEQHRATPEQWVQIERFVADCGYDACLLELRDRLAAAEQRISELEANSSAGLTGSAPAGSLVEVVEDALMREDWLNNGLDESVCGDDDPNYRYTSSACNSGHGVQTLQARAAILTCALWLEQLDVAPALQAARWLRGEVERG